MLFRSGSYAVRDVVDTNAGMGVLSRHAGDGVEIVVHFLGLSNGCVVGLVVLNHLRDAGAQFIKYWIANGFTIAVQNDAGIYATITRGIALG